MNLYRFDEGDDPSSTLDLTPYVEDGDEPTLEVCISKSDAIWAAQEQARTGNNEGAASWLLIAGSL